MAKSSQARAVAEIIETVAPEWPADRVERRALASLIPYAQNARAHSDAQVAQLAASIREWGWTTPVLIDEGAGIIAGHGRVLAAQSMGLDEVPVIVARGWSDAQKRAYVLADNKLGLNSTWDDGLLAAELSSLQAAEFDMGLIGFSPGELTSIFADGSELEAEARGGSAYREQYGVIVICRDEAHQREIFERLSGEGLDAKVVAT